MINIILFEPEIPPNTGNIIRLCANTGFKLHLVKPLGFNLEHKRLRRAGLDYAEFAQLALYDDFSHYQDAVVNATSEQIYACTTKAKRSYTEVAFKAGDHLLFGPETRGLPDDLLDSMPSEQKIKIPMQPQSRSLNLSNAVSIIAFEAWRQLRFEGAS